MAIAAGVAVAAAAGGAWYVRSRKPPVGVDIPAEFLERGAALVREHPVVDVHSHAGRSFLLGADPENLMIRLMRDGFEAERVNGMRHAGVTASLFSIVADLQVLGLADGRIEVVREFEPGEAWSDFNRQLERLVEIVELGVVSRALSPADVRSAHRNGQAAALFASEGADFLEDRIERLADVHAAGLRSVTLIHYKPNRLGDPQTSPPVHRGLTPFGSDVVREMNGLGMIIDVAHASFLTCADIVAASRAPVMLSHSNLENPAIDFARFISVEHARMVADAGGVIGAWPAGIGSESLADFAAQVLALIDVAGVEHVAVGSDMDANVRPVLTEYADFPTLAALLLYRGLAEPDVARVLGGNFLRLFDDVLASA